MLETYAVAEKTLGMLHEGLTSRARVPELQLWHTVKIRETEYRLLFKHFYYTVKNTTIPESYFKDSQVDRPYITVQLRKK